MRVLSISAFAVAIGAAGAELAPKQRRARVARSPRRSQVDAPEAVPTGRVIILGGSRVVARGGASASSQLTMTEAMLAGSMARLVAQTLLHPLDVIRTRAQAKSVEGGVYAIRAMVYGLVPQMGLSVPAGAIQFSVINVVLAAVGAHLGPAARRSLAAQLLAPAVATAVAATIRVPQELLKQTCMAGVYPNAYAALTDLWAQGGLSRLYTGALATIVRDVLWNALSFSLFNLLAPAASSTAGYGRGIFCGALAAVLTHPLDILKTRTMIGAADATGTLYDQLKKMVEVDGPAVLLKGLLPRIMLASLVLATNELVALQILKRKDEAAAAKKNKRS